MASAHKFDDAYLWNVKDAEVERVCAYVTDDGMVAGYLGISRQRVAAIRANMPVRQRNPKRFLDARAEPKGAADGNGRALVDRREATEGSAQLVESCNMLFRKYGKKFGIGVDEAMVVQLFGWPILNRLKARA